LVFKFCLAISLTFLNIILSDWDLSVGVLIPILTVILEYVQKLFQMERFVGLSLKQGMENPEIG
jgi:hypothetical protein